MDVFAWVQGWTVASWMRASAPFYAVINTTHLFGIALLVGGIVPLDFALAGVIRKAPLAVLAPFLTRSAAVGLFIAVTTGLVLWSVRPQEYLANPAFQVKLVVLAIAAANIAAQHRQRGWQRALQGQPVSTGTRLLALTSLTCWLAAMLAGRWIGFT